MVVGNPTLKNVEYRPDPIVILSAISTVVFAVPYVGLEQKVVRINGNRAMVDRNRLKSLKWYITDSILMRAR